MDLGLGLGGVLLVIVDGIIQGVFELIETRKHGHGGIKMDIAERSTTLIGIALTMPYTNRGIFVRMMSETSLPYLILISSPESGRNLCICIYPVP